MSSDAPQVDLTLVLESCNAALGEGRCVAEERRVAQERKSEKSAEAEKATEPAERSEERFSAKVRMQENEVWVELTGGAEPRRRTLHFYEEDSLAQRERAAGLLVAAMAAAELAEESQLQSPPERPKEPQTRADTFHLQGGMQLGSSRVQGGPAWGGLFNADYRFGGRWGPSLLADFVFSKGDEVRLLATGVGLGIHFDLLPERMPLRWLLQTYGRLELDALGARGEEAYHAPVVLGGARASMSWSLRNARFSPLFGIYGQALFPQVIVEEGGQELLSVQQVGFGGYLGFDWQLVGK